MTNTDIIRTDPLIERIAPIVFRTLAFAAAAVLATPPLLLAALPVIG